MYIYIYIHISGIRFKKKKDLSPSFGLLIPQKATSFNTTQMGASQASSSMENHVASVFGNVPGSIGCSEIRELWKTQNTRQFGNLLPGFLEMTSEKHVGKQELLHPNLCIRNGGFSHEPCYLLTSVHSKKSRGCLIMHNFERHPLGPSLTMTIDTTFWGLIATCLLPVVR